jgi:type I restriction enzyme S subunit
MVSELRIEATVNQALGTLVFSDSAIFIQPFVKVFLTSNYVQLRRQAAGGMQPNLNLGIVKQIVIPLPPISEHASIVAEVASRVSQIDAAETSVEYDLVRADRLRQSILKRAFEGKLVPQDPKDEPAGVLLERLRISRLSTEGNSEPSTRVQTSRRKAKSKQSE